MIQNERQYKITKGQIARLEAALEGAQTVEDDTDPRVFRAMIAGIESQIGELTEELSQYERLKETECLRLDSATGLAQILIMARVARGYSQKDLADRLKLTPQQIQRYEATGYRSASLQRVMDVMAALQIDFQADIPLRAGR